MQKKLSLKLLPSQLVSEETIKEQIAFATGIKKSAIHGFRIQKKSIDARGQKVYIPVTLTAYINEPVQEELSPRFQFKNVANASKKVIIIGAGPTGLFTALKLLEKGIQPIILERGKDVRSRRRDLAILNKDGIVNPESNYCFGEGGAGTYSDGKLYTRSTKRGNINRILDLFIFFGAPPHIGYDAHPHIGTNKLPQIITAMRECILNHGGKFIFDKKLTGFTLQNHLIKSVKTADGDEFTANAYVLATGHSARDIFKLLQNQNILIEAKPFALGVRIEHPQALIDNIQYHCTTRDPLLPPASYALVNQVYERGVFSFCMCPGGIIAPASTDPGELVVNGWSPSKRNNPFANSGMVVQFSKEDVNLWMRKNPQHTLETTENDPLLFMHFQQAVEKQCFRAGGGKFMAPAQRMIDFTKRKISDNLPANSYLPGLQASSLHEVLPGFINNSLVESFTQFGKKMKGYFTNEATVVATESRTSSPVRIPRDRETGAHVQIKNLYPAGEGAGYAGGIVSAAMDGERIAESICTVLGQS